MRTVFTFTLGLLLSVCLTLYGSFSMAGTGGGAEFSMEICADGVAKTVLIDPDGNPVEPAASCPECLDCCQAIGTLVPRNCLVNLSFADVEMVLQHLSPQAPSTIKRHILPAPRGPPTMQEFTLIKTKLILVAPIGFDHMTRSNGQLLFKDALA